MIKNIMIISLLCMFALAGFARENEGAESEVKSDVPEKIQLSFDGLLKTRTSNGVYNLSELDTYFYVLQKSVFVNFLFTADLDASIEAMDTAAKAKVAESKLKYDTYVAEMEKKTEEENLKIEAKNKKIKDETKKIPLKTFKKPEAPVFKKRSSYHILYLKVMKDGAEYQKFKAPVPYDGTGGLEYFSFGLILEPGKYQLLIVVDAVDKSEDGTLLAELEVPKMTLMDIAAPREQLETSRPVFYKAVNTLLEPEKRFTVVRDHYQIGIIKQEFSPYTGTDYKFKSGDAPVLTFFLKGAKMAQKNPPWDLDAVISILKGKNKVAVFKPVKLQNPYFFQPVKLVGKKNADLEEGSYTLSIELTDNNMKGLKGSVSVPFEIIK